MITHIRLENFKGFQELDIPVGPVTVCVGPNNSGKTTALQALTLWDLAARKWWEQKAGSQARTRTGVTLNRQDLYAIPIPEAKLLWNDLHVKSSGGQEGGFVFIRMRLYGLTGGRSWQAGLELYYANPESIYARPFFEGAPGDLSLALGEVVTFLPPMSGLSSTEERLEMGSIRRRIGEGRTAEVLRNLLWKLYSDNPTGWETLCRAMIRHFGVRLSPPEYNPATSLIGCKVQEERRPEMDITSTGRGFQQTLLIFSFLYSQPHTILLLDEPDAHLEILRQKSLFQALVEEVKNRSSQLIIATHSEAILNLAAQDDVVIAFIGKPHQARNARELGKSLMEIPYADYLLAESERRVLYLEGMSDLELLRAFAEVLEHPVRPWLERPFVSYLNSNNVDPARNHFRGLREAVPGLKGFLLTDRLERNFEMPPDLEHRTWLRREIENYLPLPEALYGFFEAPEHQSDLFSAEAGSHIRSVVADLTSPAALRDKNDLFWRDQKISEWLGQILARHYEESALPQRLDKGRYYLLLRNQAAGSIDPEVTSMLDRLLAFFKED